MKIQNLILLVFGVVGLTAGAMAFGYFLTQDSDDEEAPSRSTATTQQVQGETSLNVSSSVGVGQLFGTADTSSNENSNSNSSQGELPGPQDFEVYEQYANEQNALFTDVELGDGNEARPGDAVALVYQGYLTDGTLFDQSRTNEDGLVEPFVFTLGSGQVIRGWEEAIPGMKLGGKRRLVIPAVAAYGEQGQNQIPPNSMLIFDVELVQIEKAPAPPTGL